MTVKVFTVFHDKLDERLIFAPFSPPEIERFFTPFAVSERYAPKVITRMNGETTAVDKSAPGVIFESGLEKYDPSVQTRGFMETSCYIHVLMNDLHRPLSHVGVAQYDMRWTPNAAAILRGLAEGATSATSTVYGLICGKLMDKAGKFHPWACAERRNWSFLLESYNRFFGQNWDAGMLVEKPFTLFQTYILPRSEFVALASWLKVLCDEVFPWACQPPYETHWGALSGYTERAESLFVAARLHEGAFSLRHLPLVHDHEIPERLGITKAHYGRN